MRDNCKGMRGFAMRSLFSPTGRSAERLRGDEGVGRQMSVAWVEPPHPPFGHLLPAGEKRGTPPATPKPRAILPCFGRAAMA
ncbi:hypothetical protein AX760_15365 [Pararhizobium antarcticum]|uniref:Uncharacterized protein n=1 Tax=Pararhizobium antarcticum TaxID=1798805 RepID=A0A657LUJ9_9HYPH|nr:hypothetical protein AX761_14970 [Rhizobium sp. 58]OJF98055.1 hypothetical protein AX760_15365 [Pararhizobium antarcticum]